MDCVAIGDSIAVGLSQASRCTMQAKVGRTSSQQAAMIKIINTDLVVISLGSNDPMHPELIRNLRHVRASVVATKVIWIVPYHRYAASAVRKVADERMDGIIELRMFPTNDGVHPANYSSVANRITLR
jgi:lysophospholipase L1-like esterase